MHCSVTVSPASPRSPQSRFVSNDTSGGTGAVIGGVAGGIVRLLGAAAAR